jgi:glycosyltransferase involved in cell wall biosynthesis
VRVVIVNSKLKDYSGHEFHNTLSLCTQLETEGVPATVVGNRGAERLPLPRFVPFFPEWVSEPLEGRGPVKVWSFARRTRKFVAIVEDLFRAYIFPHVPDVILIHSPREFELLGWGLFLYKNRKVLSRDVRVVVLSLIDYQRPSRMQTIFLREIYRLSLRLLSKIHVRVATVSHLIKQAYEAIADVEVELFPDLAVGVGSLPDCDLEGGCIEVVYLGGARYTKGFDILVEAVQRLVQMGDLCPSMRFWIQSNVQPGINTDVVRQAVVRLQRLSSQYGAVIRLVEGPLRTAEYYQLLARADIVVLPYRAQFYRTLVSGPFVEAMYFAKVPVVPRGTWMAEQARKYHLDGVIFDSQSVDSLVLTILSVAKDITAYKQKVHEASLAWRDFHNAHTFVRMLFRDGKDARRS